jgi:hypothetical protein
VHAVVAHDDAVVDTNGVEFEWDAAGGAHCLFHDASKFLEVHVTGDDVDIRIADRDEWFVEITHVADLARGAEEAPVRGAAETPLDGVGAVV